MFASTAIIYDWSRNNWLQIQVGNELDFWPMFCYSAVLPMIYTQRSNPGQLDQFKTPVPNSTLYGHALQKIFWSAIWKALLEILQQTLNLVFVYIPTFAQRICVALTLLCGLCEKVMKDGLKGIDKWSDIDVIEVGIFRNVTI